MHPPDYLKSFLLSPGLDCSKEGDHGTYYEIEPTTGTVLSYRKRIQATTQFTYFVLLFANSYNFSVQRVSEKERED